MTLLPLIGRELRLRARRRGNYWTRFGAGLGGVLLCFPILLGSGPFLPGAAVGKGVFDGLVGIAFVFSCTACLLTAESVASEQREGTLGLLFLTRVRALDVLLGKLGSAGLSSLCALLAFVPVMMLPLLAGGVTGGEACRKGLALLATLGLALALGLWAAAGSRQTKVVRNAAGAMLLLALVPFGFWQFAAGPLKRLGVLSPLVGVVSASDFYYRISAGWFWASLAAAVALACLCLLMAGLRLRRVIDNAGEPVPARPAPFLLVDTDITARGRWEPNRDKSSPVGWLVTRQSGIRTSLWAAALLTLFSHSGNLLWMRLLGRGLGRGAAWSLVWMVPWFALALLEGGLIAWAAGRFFINARRSSELEVLLTTPVGVGTVLADQWRTLQRLLRWPVLLMVLPLLVQFLLVLNSLPGPAAAWPSSAYQFQSLVSQVLAMVGVLLHVGALCWLGMWFGLKARTASGAIAWSVGLAVGLPYLLSMLYSSFFGLYFGRFFSGLSTWYFLVYSSASSLLYLGVSLGLLLWARSRLKKELSRGGPVPFQLEELWAGALQELAGAVRKARHWTPSNNPRPMTHRCLQPCRRRHKESLTRAPRAVGAGHTTETPYVVSYKA